MDQQQRPQKKREELGFGYARGSDGLLTKKYDPHAETRAKQYDEELKAHRQHRRNKDESSSPTSFVFNDASTVGARGEAARSRALAKREEKAARARKFNERHARAVAKHSELASHRENEKYSDDLHEAYGLEKRETPATEGRGSLRLSRCRGNSWEPREFPQEATRRWRRGPEDARGGVVDFSDRPLLCVSVSHDGTDCCVGSADHAAYAMDPLKTADAGDKKVSVVTQRRLYSKTDGHAEWVTAVAHVGKRDSAREVLTAGMDGKVIHWRGTRATELQSAGASVSALAVDVERRNVAVTCAYDGRSTVWQTDLLQSCATFGVSKAPVLCACWSDSILVAGDRDGAVAAYDVERCADLGVWGRDEKKKHCGHVLSVAALPKLGLFAAGSHDGKLRLWDPRGSTPCVARIDAHLRGDKAGALGTICPLSDDNDDLIATAGADGRLKVFDLRSYGVSSSSPPPPPRGKASGTPVLTFESHGAATPLCMVSLGPFLISGDSRGNVLCHDTLRGDCAWGLGANRGAVRAVDARPDLLVACGDDGNCIAWRF